MTFSRTRRHEHGRLATDTAAATLNGRAQLSVQLTGDDLTQDDYDAAAEALRTLADQYERRTPT